MKNIKSVVVLFLCFVFLCSVTVNGVSVSAETNTDDSALAVGTLDEYMNISESEYLSLYVNTSNANIAVLDKRTGKVWSAYNDTLSGMDSRTSMLNVTYSGGNNITAQVGTHDASTGFDIIKIQNGIKEIFYFETENLTFEIPFKVVLKEDFVEITLLYRSIKEKGTGKISDIELLPNWAAGTAEQNGYMFIPDGSGAIIEYKDIASRIDQYSGRVYGDDPSQDLVYPEISDSQSVRMPIFGVGQDDNAILTVITLGEEFASVNATINNNTATVAASFIYRESDLTGIQENGGGTRTMTILQSKPIAVEPTIRQYYLSGDNADYSGMANAYRKHLENNGTLKNKTKKKTPAVAIEAFGAVTEKKSFLGVPYNQTLSVTTFKELETLASRFQSEGINDTPFYLYGFLDGGFESGTNVKPRYISKLGGKRGYADFVKLAGDSNVYTVYNISRSFGRVLDFFRTGDYMKSLNQTTVEQHYRLLASGNWNTNFGVWKYFTVEKQKKMFTSLVKNLPENNNIVIERSGEELITDFNNKDGYARNDYMHFLKQMFKKLNSKKTKLAFESGNAYAVGSASDIYEIPLDSSGYSIESYQIPFYTMVFHGYISLSSNAINDVSNTKSIMLKAFEQGVSPLWRVTGIDSYELKDTKLNFLYNSQIDSLYNNIVSMASDYSDVHSTLYNQCIIKHEYQGDLSITTYENGWKIVCNYGDEVITYNDIEVPSTDYIVIK